MFSKAKYLAAASMVEYGFQLLVPIYLVRVLSEADFASYRFLWLLVATLVGSAFLNVPASLCYFLPRRERSAQGGFIAQTVAFTAAVGLLAFGLLAFAAAMAPDASVVRLLPRPLMVFGAFVVLLSATAAMDYLPTARGDVPRQAGLNLATALVRAGCVIAGASFGSISSVCWALLVFAAFRVALFAFYISRTTPAPSGRLLSRGRFRDHFAYAAPFGLATAFWLFRSQGEQWIGAAILPAREYAALSIAAVVIPLLAIVQQSLTASTVAEVNRLESQGHVRAMVRLNARSNELAALCLFPLVAFLFVASSPLVETVYTSAYIDAALVLKLLCVGFVGGFIEVSSLAKALRMQREVLVFDATMLAVSIAISIAGAWYWGLAGIVLGSIASRFASTAYFLTVLSHRTGVARRRLQNWSAIGRALGSALVAGLLAWVLVEGALRDQANVVKVVAVALCVGLVYFILTWAMGLWNRRDPLPQPTVAGGLYTSPMGQLTMPGGL